MFRTELKIPKSEKEIKISDFVLSLGSCFATNIGNKLNSSKIDTITNPFGIIYNPHSIFEALTKSATLNIPEQDQNMVIDRDDLNYHYLMHSEISASSKSLLNQKIQAIYEQVHLKLKQANWVFITLGTAMVYKEINFDEIVANCHKQPASLFEKSMLTPTDIVNDFSNCYQSIKSINPTINFLFTISPIRHIKDTIPANSLSKATLRLGISEITNQLKDTHYFPSYELMIDDLRDYRFYESDMIHPSEVAQDYIWNKFSQSFFSDDTQEFIIQWEKIKKSIDHKPFNYSSVSHQKFLNKLLVKLENFSSKVDVEKEISHVKSQII